MAMHLPRNRLYGYNHKEYCVPQLQKALNLENRPEEFGDTTDKIRKLVRKYLDIHKSAVERVDAMELIKKKLKKKYPALYDGEDSERRLYFVERYIDLQVHVGRHRAKTLKNKSAAPGSTRAEMVVKPEPPAKPAAQDPTPNPVPLAASPNIFGELSNQTDTHVQRRDYSPTRNVQASCSAPSSNGMSVDKDMDQNRPMFPPTPLSAARPRPKKGRFVPFVLIPALTPGSKVSSNAESSSSQDSMKEDRNKMITDDEERHTQSRPEEEPSTSASAPSGLSSDPTSSLPSGSGTAPAGTPPSESAPMSVTAPTSSFPSGSGPAPAPAPAASPAADHPTANRTQEEPGIAFVRQFLLACQPPMDHFLSQFIDFGWKNKEFLYAMSTWSDVYRVQMLRRVVGNGDGEGNMAPTEAEIAVLDYHLMRYGFQVENANADEV